VTLFKKGDRVKQVRKSDMEGGWVEFQPGLWQPRGTVQSVRAFDGAVFVRLTGNSWGMFYFPQELEPLDVVELIGELDKEAKCS